MLEMSLEEQALRHADAFFTGPEKWWQVGKPTPGWEVGMERTCIGLNMCRFLGQRNFSGIKWEWISKVLDVPIVTDWNDACPNFAALKAKFQERIEYYQKQRLSQTYLVIIGPGRQVKV